MIACLALLFGSAAASAQDAPPTDCDTYAANPNDPLRVAAGVNRKAIDVPRAISACTEALARYPDAIRFHYQLARAYRESKDSARALSHFRRAAEASYAEAQNALGTIYRNGEGVPKDLAQSASWYARAAERGHAGAQNNLAFAYENGLGVPRDLAAAVSWYRKSAEQGEASAQHNMGVVYANGQGVAKDDAQAASWYRKAAAQGNSDAQNNLGMMYWNGKGVTRDYALAFAWLSKAAGNGHQLAANNLVEMRKKNLVPKDTFAAFAEVNAAISGPTTPARQSQPSAQPAQTATGVAILTPPQSPAVAATAATGRRIALLIGNGSYIHAPVLANPANDVKALASVLQAIGFQSITVKTDLRREETISALRQFAMAADNADWAVIYYSGHGIEFNGINYMIPIDAELRADRDIDLESIDVGKAIAALEGAKRLRLIVLDACRDNPFASKMRRTMATRSIGRGLARIEPEAGTLVVYAAKHGETALDGDGTNSPFAEALIKRMPTANLEIRRLFDLVRDDVMSTTNRKQQPFSYGSLSGSEDYFFVTR
ncbi:caspase family protein [Bradyrhizobium sp.]|uniref:caspase family protein n=1 Tax=Bradyrhizobium sp. TaxID=376 RepID=UPI001D6B0DB5|nr:caspase family protein [Bradyrhizobium sp.]MBI5320099.1 SEL1-like repeat protein [Bradyrhizobium sp.]